MVPSSLVTAGGQGRTPMPAPERLRKWHDSYWIGWTFTPFLNWIAFLWIGYRARSARWALWACVYALPSVILAGLPESGTATDVVGTVASILWVVSIVHAFRVRPAYIARRRELLGLPPKPVSQTPAAHATGPILSPTGTAGGTRHRRLRTVIGVILIVLGALWTLCVGAFWLAVWALAGGEGVAITALDWRFFGPTAAGVALVAIGIGLFHRPPETAPRPTPAEAGRRGLTRRGKVIAGIVVGLAAVVGLEYWLSLPPDEGPYPFADVPAGALIAYTAPDGIRLVRSSGGDTWRIPGTGSMTGPVWSANGQRLAASGSSQAYSFTADGSSRTALPSTAMTTPVWSPDGTRLVVVDDDNPVMRVVRASDGAVLAKLPLPGNDPAWSPDGRTIAFQSNERGDLLDLYLVRPDGTGLRRLTRTPSDPNREGALGAAWSPDGRSIAFADDRNGYADIYVVRRDGTRLQRLTRTDVDESSPTWSPDGHRIAFDRTDYPRDRMSIVVLDLRTGRETELAHADGDFVLEPAWQPAAR